MPNTSVTNLCPTRRQFLRQATLAAAVPAVGPAIFGVAAPSRKPNLLVLWTDEQRADTMAAYGNTKIKVPNLNKLSEESVVFEKAYVSQPVCTPSRSTIMSGLWPHQSGLTQNNIALPPEVPTLPEIANDQEYRTGYMGKWHLGDEIFPQHGFQEWVSMEDGYSRFYGESRDQEARSDYHHFLVEKGYKPDTDGGRFSRGFAARLPIEHCKPKFLEGEACDFLRRHQNSPFMLYVNFLEPHMPFFGPLDDLHDPSDVDLPENFNDPLEENEPEAYRKAREEWLSKPYHEYDLKQEADWRRLIAKYWGLVSQVDRSIGVILDTLESLGLAGNTIVVHTSEHGDMMGAHRLIHKSVMYEEAMRVPWLMRVPALGRRQRRVPEPASHVDLIPTLIDLMGIQTDRKLPGHSQRARIEGGPAEDRDVFVQWNPGRVQGGRNPHGRLRDPETAQRDASRCIVAPDGWKLTLHTKDRHQLYDLANDPGETTNLFDVPSHRAVVERLSGRLREWQSNENDDLQLMF